jgi:cellulose synthase/poly-beta-1,6-N-acetylglucosamine synthase-like glycosyltransferase
MRAGSSHPPVRVAVVIPAWDDYVWRFLARAVSSVTSQDVPVRVIVVDNASKTPIPRLPGVEVVETGTRVSRGAARNTGLALVQEPLVVFLDADDIMLPGALAALVQGMDDNPSAVAHVLPIVDGLTGRLFRAPRRLARMSSSSRRVFAVLNEIWPMTPTQGATIMRTEVVRTAGGYGDRDKAEDWMLGARLASRGRITFGTTPGLRYHRRSTDVPATTAERREAARAVRTHLRRDPERRLLARALSPVITAVQVTLLTVRPLVLAGRTLQLPPARSGEVGVTVAEHE